MSVKIRLARIGKKNAPSYQIVVAQTRTKRNGEFLDVIGHYNPVSGEEPVIDKEKMDKWVGQGALLTTAVQEMAEGRYKHVKYNPKKDKAAEAPAEQE